MPDPIKEGFRGGQAEESAGIPPPGQAAELPPEVRRLLAKGSILPDPSEGHYSLDELRKMALERKGWGEFWEMPRHLSSCEPCLEFFECIFKGEEQVDGSVISRLDALHKPRKTLLSRMFQRPSRPVKFAAAAAVLLVAGLAALLFYIVPEAMIADGSLVLPDGTSLSSGSKAPARTLLTAKETSRAVFGDGTEIVIHRDSLMAFISGGLKGRILQLSNGTIVCDVAKQRAGRVFKVLTPAGEITVVGTKFSVESRSGAAVRRKHDETAGTGADGKKDSGAIRFLHPLQIGVRGDGDSAAASDSVATVKVEEGSVLLRNRLGGQATISKGQTGVMRTAMNVIDVFGGGEPE